MRSSPTPIAPAWIGPMLVMAAVALCRLKPEMTHLPEQAGSVEADPTPASGSTVNSAAGRDEAAPRPESGTTPDSATGAGGLTPPRVLIVGDSWAAGLGARGASYGKFAAADLGAEAVLDLAAVSKTAADTLSDAAEIREFAPTLAILFCGGTESLVHPGPVVQNLIERWGPASWRGLAGLEPRAVYSSDPKKRRRQWISAAVRVAIKRLIIRLTGGGRRTGLEPFRTGVEQLIELLDEVGASMVFISMFHVDDRLFPGTREAMADTQAVLDDILAGRPNVALVDVHDQLDYWGDFLRDNLHLNPAGHRNVANLVVQAARPLLEARCETGRLAV